jgi:CheY-like chemotaxis protein
MDHMMPGMDGIEATRIIREEIGTDYAKNVQIIALTANAIVKKEKMFLNMGFQAFLSKPIEISRLDEVLRHWVRDKSKHGWVPIGQGEGTPEDSKGGQEWEGADKIGGHDRREMGKMIPGIDALKGAERFGGLGAYLEILRSYAKNTRPLLETIRGVGRGSLEIFATRVHGLKGASYGICAFGIGAMAENLENAAKAGDYGFVEKNNGEFIETAEKLISNINKTLAEIDDQAPKPRKEMPDKEVLAKLLDACHNYDMDGAEEAMAVIDSYEYGSDNGFVAWLRENVSMANFVQVGDKLSFLLDRAETNDGH